MGRSDTKKTVSGSTRVGLLDELRGFAIICMVVYHAMYDLKYIFGVDVPIFFEGWFDIIRDIFAGMFIFISGTVCRYSSNNMKRGIQCFFTGGTIMFGILHLLGISMMLFGLGEKLLDMLPATVGLIVSALLFVLTIGVKDHYFGIGGVFALTIPQAAYDVGVLFPLGLHGANFYSADYFPMMPWFFLFIAGSYFGIYAKDGALPKFFYPTHIKWLGNVGRYTIWVYVLHQPVLYILFTLIFNFIR